MLKYLISCFKLYANATRTVLYILILSIVPFHLFPRNAYADLAPNSVPLSFRIGRPDPPVAPDPRVTTDRSSTDRHQCRTINQPPAGICSSMANKRARLMIYYDGVSDMHVHCSRPMCSWTILRSLFLSFLRGRGCSGPY